MRKTLVITVFCALISGACNKNKKFNKRLDGTWITTSINGVDVSSDDAIKYEFSKSDKDGGKIKITYFDGGNVDDEFTGTYKITEGGKTITIDTAGSATAGSRPDTKIHLVDVITEQEKTKFTAHELYSEIPSGYTGTDIFVFKKL